MTDRYDIIGDIHGHADELEALLAKLGYMDKGGTFHPPGGRRAVFRGDYIDRGPKIHRVLEIVRSMVETGSAFAILGNHEVNALRYHHAGSDGEPLRPHTPKYRSQHLATLEQIAVPFPDYWQSCLEWFARLPLWLDFGGFRVVHAAWDEAAMAVLRDARPLTGSILERFSIKGTTDYESINRLINGPEAPLLNGASVAVKGTFRKEVRVRWWSTHTPATARDAIYPSDASMPAAPIAHPEIAGYPEDAPPDFFGHYAVPISEAIAASNAACLDFGIGKNGTIGAYRWDGEPQISAEKLLWQ